AGGMGGGSPCAAPAAPAVDGMQRAVRRPAARAAERRTAAGGAVPPVPPRRGQVRGRGPGGRRAEARWGGHGGTAPRRAGADGAAPGSLRGRTRGPSVAGWPGRRAGQYGWGPSGSGGGTGGPWPRRHRVRRAGTAERGRRRPRTGPEAARGWGGRCTPCSGRRPRRWRARSLLGAWRLVTGAAGAVSLLPGADGPRELVVLGPALRGSLAAVFVVASQYRSAVTVGVGAVTIGLLAPAALWPYTT